MDYCPAPAPSMFVPLGQEKKKPMSFAKSSVPYYSSELSPFLKDLVFCMLVFCAHVC